MVCVDCRKTVITAPGVGNSPIRYVNAHGWYKSPYRNWKESVEVENPLCVELESRLEETHP